MARVQSPIIGRAKGQAGGMVFTTLNGQNVMKARPYSYRDANTDVQQENRRISTLCTRIAGAMKDSARSFFLVQPSDMPAYSKMVQQFQRLIDRSKTPYQLLAANNEIGTGNVSISAAVDTYSPVNGLVTVTFSKANFRPGTDLTRNVKAYAFNQLTGEMLVNGETICTIADETGTFAIPPSSPAATTIWFLSMDNGAGGSELQKTVKIMQSLE